MRKLFKSIELNPSWLKDITLNIVKKKLDFLASVFDLDSAKLVNKYVETQIMIFKH